MANFLRRVTAVIKFFMEKDCHFTIAPLFTAARVNA